MNAIRCENLSRFYGDVVAVQDLNLEVPVGSVFGFLGRNGAGKTTTIRLFAGLARPTSGRAWIDGVETTRAESSARARFGYLPQDPAFYNWMTPVEYLDYIGQLFHMDKIARRRRADAMLELVDLTDAAKRRIGGFSGGMMQRLGIAQALLHEPPVLLLDEPTSALDPAGRYAVLELIQRLRGQVTVFLSSHILGDVERVCDTIGIIHQGKLRLVETRDALLAKHATNIILLEVDDLHQQRLNGLLSQLKAQAWVAGIVQDGSEIRAAVHDPLKAKEALLPLLVSAGITLNRYEWIRPSLEDIFLNLSERP